MRSNYSAICTKSFKTRLFRLEKFDRLVSRRGHCVSEKARNREGNPKVYINMVSLGDELRYRDDEYEQYQYASFDHFQRATYVLYMRKRKRGSA